MLKQKRSTNISKNVVLDVQIDKTSPNKITHKTTLADAASKALCVYGHYAITHFPQLVKISGYTTLAVNLTFVNNSHNLPCLLGTIKTQLLLVCQRCLEALQITINQQTKLVFTSSEVTTKLELGFERVDLLTQELSIVDIISDEVLLSIPMSPKHRYCSVQKETLTPIKNNQPFAILKSLKQTNKE